MFKPLFSAKWLCDTEGVFTCTTKPIQIQDWFHTGLSAIEEKQVDFASVQLIQHKGILVVTDRFSTIPVFVCFKEGIWYVSDYVSEIKKHISLSWNKDVLAEQLLFDYTFSPKATLYNEIQKVESGVKALLKSDGSIELIESLSSELPEPKTCSSLSSKQIEELGKAMQEYILPHRKLYIPLSGGLDSRIVCGMSKAISGANIWSRTYGDRKSLDVKYGTQVAKKLGIQHQVVAKTNKKALAEFEMMVQESCGLLNGVHAHDLEGRLLFEENQEYTAKVSGFIGDVFARGTNMKETETDRKRLIRAFIRKWTNLNTYDYNALGLQQEVLSLDTKIDDFINQLSHTKDLHWAFYQKVRIPNMVSLLEYHSTISKPNIKPFIVPSVRKFISEYAARDQWDGMNYVEIAKGLIPHLIKIPFASNSVFYSKQAQFCFRLRKKIYRTLTHQAAYYSKGKIQALPFNATLNWRRILSEEKDWVLQNVSKAADTFHLNATYLKTIYDEHVSGRRDHQEFILRIVNLGVLAAL